MGCLTDRVAIVTGGGRGIGRATALRFAQEGARILVATRSAEPGHETVDAIRAAGGTAVLEVCDMGDRASSRQIVKRAVEEFGKLDIVLHNAASGEGGYIATAPDSRLEQILNVGLKPCFWLTADALPYLEQSPAPRILITSSISGNHYVTPGRAAYSAMKSGVTGFIRSAAIELAAKRITVNGVEPGVTLTEQFCAHVPSDIVADMTGGIPLGRGVKPDEIADAFVYLASDSAAMMTGQSLVIDGGASLGPDKPLTFDDH